MDLKLLEDLAALAKERSYVRAAAARHITHPAFGRRIRQLEEWAGCALVESGRSPIALTSAGAALLQQTQPLLEALKQTRDQLRSTQGHTREEVFRLGTGRTLARTLVADWLSRLSRPKQPLDGHRVEVQTGSMTQVSALIERGDVDLAVAYEHVTTSARLSTQRFRHITLAHDKLVPVSRVTGRGTPLHDLHDGSLIGYSASLSLGGMVLDHLQRTMPDAGSRMRFVCDSPDAIQELVLRGLGAAWLPWSLVSADCTRKVLMPLGGRSNEVHFQVRLYRPRARQSPLVESIWSATDQ